MVEPPIWKILVKLDHFPKVRGENKKCLKPPPRYLLTENTWILLVLTPGKIFCGFNPGSNCGRSVPKCGLKVERSKHCFVIAESWSPLGCLATCAISKKNKSIKTYQNTVKKPIHQHVLTNISTLSPQLAHDRSFQSKARSWTPPCQRSCDHNAPSRSYPSNWDDPRCVNLPSPERKVVPSRSFTDFRSKSFFQTVSAQLWYTEKKKHLSETKFKGYWVVRPIGQNSKPLRLYRPFT